MNTGLGVRVLIFYLKKNASIPSAYAFSAFYLAKLCPSMLLVNFRFGGVLVFFVVVERNILRKLRERSVLGYETP